MPTSRPKMTAMMIATLSIALAGTAAAAVPRLTSLEQRPAGQIAVRQPSPPSPDIGAMCLQVSTDYERDGARTLVHVVVSNRCQPNVIIDAKVDLMAYVLGSSHAWVIDEKPLVGGKAVLDGATISGIVGQASCTRITGTWIIPETGATGTVDRSTCP